MMPETPSMQRIRSRAFAALATLLFAFASVAVAGGHASAQGASHGGATNVRIDPRSGLEFLLLPGGPFHFGCEPNDGDCSDDERPGRQATVTSMWMGKTEVTVEGYGRCVTDGACTAPVRGDACNWGVAGRERHPINCVDWAQASAFCAHLGGRLPTAEEWEYAAKGGLGRIFPWGDEPVTDQRANFADVQYKRKYPRSFDVPGQDDGWIETAPVGTYPAGATVQGLLDMVGNVIEWTSSVYQDGLMEARGGGWATDTVSRRLRPSYRTGRPRTFSDTALGFRCRLP
jgi:formylglycine-generating enzyme required for sulfatase activity